LCDSDTSTSSVTGWRTGVTLARVPVATSLHYLIHWPTHGGYNFVSGPLADITLITAFASSLYLFLRKHNCHVHRC
jgi:hypothetical protein